jgi:DNA replication and repair protein RecF
MQLNSLSISNLRNLQSVHFDLHSHFNIICGENGSGKTSLLEAIHLLSTGRSFRAKQAKQIIRFGQKACLVAGAISPVSDTNRSTRIGVERLLNGSIKIRVAEQDCASIAELAKNLPLQLINSESYCLLEASPQYRRQFLDWILFHVEHSFFPVWQRFKRALQQRNAALRGGRSCSQQDVRAWDKELSAAGVEIDQQRKRIVEELLPVFTESIESLLTFKDGLKIQYLSGWDKEQSLEEALMESFERDIAWGYTTVGPQRAEVEFWVDGAPAKTLLSRGQLKLFICALLMARAKLLAKSQGRRCLFLIDDLTSELDQGASTHLLDALFKLGSQVVIACIDAVPLVQALGDRGGAWFEMKGGVLRRL